MKTFYSMKESRYKRPSSVQFYLSEVLRMGSSMKTAVQRPSFLGAKRNRRMTGKIYAVSLGSGKMFEPHIEVMAS